MLRTARTEQTPGFEGVATLMSGLAACYVGNGLCIFGAMGNSVVQRPVGASRYRCTPSPTFTARPMNWIGPVGLPIGEPVDCSRVNSNN